MNAFIVWFRRKLPINLLLILLLSIGVAACVIGVQTYLASGKQVEAIDQIYTTVVIPHDTRFPGHMPIASTEKGLEYYDLNTLSMEAPVSVRSCQSVLLQGFIPGSSCLTSEDFTTIWRSYDRTGDLPYQACVIAARCEKRQDRSEERIHSLFSPDGTLIESSTERELFYDYDLTFLEALSLRAPGENYYPANKLLFSTNLCKDDGTPLLEEGKTYLMWGTCEYLCPFFYDEETLSVWNPICETEEINQDGTIYSVAISPTPIAVEYQGDLHSFLETDTGRIWKEELIPSAERNQQSVKVIATDCTEGLAPFCTRQSNITEGRTFSSDEAKAGKRVCLVSAAWAEKNKVALGDTLTISFFAPRVEFFQPIRWENGSFIGEENDQAQIWMQPSVSSDATGQTDEYEIIGIYTCPPYEGGSLSIAPDTVILPKASVENAMSYFTNEYSHYPLLNSWLIPNGSQETLKSWFEANTLSGLFQFYDYGYSIASDAVTNMENNGIRILAVGTGIYVLVLLAFSSLLSLLLSRSFRVMRLLGQTSNAAHRSYSAALPLWVIPGVILGTLLAWGIFDYVSARLLSQTTVFAWLPAVICMIVLLIAAYITLWGMGRVVSRKRLLEVQK